LKTRPLSAQDLEITVADDNALTLPLEHQDRRLPVDPTNALTRFAPPTEALIELSAREEFPDSREPGGPPSMPFAAKAFSALPDDAPEWMRAARVLADSLEECIRSGNVDDLEQAAIERAWYAWTLGGATPRHVLKTAHLVRRAHEALQAHQQQMTERFVRDCAEVMHANLPAAVRQTLPFERVVWVAHLLRAQADPWVAVVEGTAELLGWKDYARVHASNVIRSVIQQK
jgi:hypothetical protein